MLSYLQQLVNSLNRPKNYLLVGNVLLVVFLIIFTNLGVLPFKNFGDFIFFAIIGLALALYRPGWAFLFFIGTIMLENINIAPKGFLIDIRPYQFFGAVIILALAIRYFSKRLNFKLAGLKWFDYVLMIFAVAGFVSAFFAQDKGLALKQSVILLSFLFLYFLTRTYIQTLEDLKKVVPFFLSSSIVVIFYGLWQNVRFLHGLNSFEIMPGRPNATFAEPDWLGIFIVLLIAVIYSIIYYSKSSKINTLSIRERVAEGRVRESVLYVFLIPIYILLILTVSRSAWLGALCITILFLKIILTGAKFNPKYWQWKQFFKQSVFLAIAIFAACFFVYFFQLTSFQLFDRAGSAGTGLQKITIACDTDIKNNHNDYDRLQNDYIKDVSELEKYGCRHIDLEDIEKEKTAGNIISEIYRPDPNFNIRQVIYQKSVAEIKKHPILGIGWGSIGKILGTDERGTSLNSSNIFLEVWLGSGIIGFLAFLTILGYIFIQSIRNLLKESLKLKILGLFVLLGFMALMIPNLFNAGIFLGILWIWLGIVQVKET